MRRCLDALKHERSFYEILAKSFIVSSDMAHAVHPNYSDKHQSQHKPSMHKASYLLVYRSGLCMSFSNLLVCHSARLFRFFARSNEKALRPLRSCRLAFIGCAAAQALCICCCMLPLLGSFIFMLPHGLSVGYCRVSS